MDSASALNRAIRSARIWLASLRENRSNPEAIRTRRVSIDTSPAEHSCVPVNGLIPCGGEAHSITAEIDELNLT
jgi:hypothetical protein